MATPPRPSRWKMFALAVVMLLTGIAIGHFGPNVAADDGNDENTWRLTTVDGSDAIDFITGLPATCTWIKEDANFGMYTIYYACP